MEKEEIKKKEIKEKEIEERIERLEDVIRYCKSRNSAEEIEKEIYRLKGKLIILNLLS